MTKNIATRSPLNRLIEDDAIGQLRRRDGLMATLGSENGALKLDWVEGIARLLADPTTLEELETEARDIRQRGIRHIIWAGMGGSVIAVRVLRDLGYCDGPRDPFAPGNAIAIHPLDSTDPAAINAIMREIAAAKNLPLQAPASHQEASRAQAAGDDGQRLLHSLLHDVMMIGVSMGMTSEEPITHLTWFTELLNQAQLPPSAHLLVMTLPGSYLDVFAQEHRAPSRSLQLDGETGTGGRMSAPTTRVFLLPAALYLTGISDTPGQLRSVLQHAWDVYNLEMAASHPAKHPFVQLAAALSAASVDDACRLLVSLPEGWRVLLPWIEQLMEESLGKGGKGIVVFDDQPLHHSAPGYRHDGLLYVRVVTEATHAPSDHLFFLTQPSLASNEPHMRLAAVAASFLGWQLSMALYGYLHRIQFAGQPAVENYKARARALSSQPDPLQIASTWHPTLRNGRLTLLAPPTVGGPQPGDAETSMQAPSSVPLASAFANAVQSALGADDRQGHPQQISLGYIDLTVNGESGASFISTLDRHIRSIGNTLMGVPVKLRRAPSAYHSTEQSEMDGPPYLISLRLVARNSEACLLGSYSSTFLHAQAVSAWQAMAEVNRPCFLLIIDGTLDDAIAPIGAFFAQLESHLYQP